MAARQRLRTPITVALALAAAGSVPAPAPAHVFVFEHYRAGTFPSYPGSGWVAEAYLHIPDDQAAHLVSAERYIDDNGIPPDFTFRTAWIDFPAGPVAFLRDDEIPTIGDLLDDYIYDVSDPSKLSEPFSNVVIRFRGYLKVDLGTDVSGEAGLPVWVEFGSLGHDGYRTRVVDTIYRQPLTNVAFPFFHENCIVLGLGLFPIEITYFNRYDPDGLLGREYAGIELYSWHEGGLSWPGGDYLVHPVYGPATIVPPEVIYQPQDIQQLVPGDFDADGDVDNGDLGWFQTCFTGAADEDQFFLDLGCTAVDFHGDEDVDLDDYEILRTLLDP